MASMFKKITIKTKLSADVCQKWLQDRTINPVTGRFIKFNGPTYKTYQEACRKHGIIIDDIGWADYKCNNDSDPISGADYHDMSHGEFADIIRLGSGMCYPVESLYGWYNSIISNSYEDQNKKVTDPMVPSYVLTQEEIEKINNYMFSKDRNYKKPVHKIRKHPLPGYTFEVDQDFDQYLHIHPIYIYTPYGGRRRIGHLPMESPQSYVALTRLYELWNLGLLMENNDPNGYTRSPMLNASINPLIYMEPRPGQAGLTQQEIINNNVELLSMELESID